MPSIRVLLVEDHEQVRQGLTQLLNSHDDIDVIGAVATVTEAIDELTNHAPDVAVIDVQLPDGTGFDLCHRVQTISPRTRTIIHTSVNVNPELAATPGVHAVVLKQMDTSQLLATIRKLANPEP